MKEIAIFLLKEIGKQMVGEVTKETARKLVKRAFESFSRNNKKKKR
jgi:hypothetical protein